MPLALPQAAPHSKNPGAARAMIIDG